MPTISFNYSDFEKLLGKKLPFEKFRGLALMYAKAEVDGYDEASNEVKLSLDDTNLPYLWSVEGLARLFRGILEIDKGLPKLKVSSSRYRVIVESSVKKYRPYIAAFVAEGKKLDDYLLQQLIQLQEKFCEGYGRKRQKVSIGLYSHKKIKFPVYYRAAKPDSVEFVPLEDNVKMALSKVLEAHPKGRQYGWIIKGFPAYPILMDSNNEVLSLVPVINSDFTGKLVVGDSEMLFEATGTDEESVNLAANIFAQNLFERGFSISAVTVEDGSHKFATPKGFNDKVNVSQDDVKKLTGISLGWKQVSGLLEKARYGISGNSVLIPDYRRDILHVFDVIEDVAIMYGFGNIESAPLESYTLGEPADMTVFTDKVRELGVGLGFQEILSPILSNRAVLEKNMEISSSEIVEIDNIMSETFSAVRNWLIPIMLEVLSKNKHNEYPQKIFEEGTVNLRSGGRIDDRESIAFAVSHGKADFTEARQCADAIMKSLGIDYSIKPHGSGAFIPGRAGIMIVKGKSVGVIGEISPKVLSNWQLEMPVSVLELDLTELKKLC